MNFNCIRLIPVIAPCMLATLSGAFGQSLDTPATRLQPIGAPSAVDRYRQPAEQQIYRETAYQSLGQRNAVRQTVMQQPFTAPQLPAGAPGGFAPPPIIPSQPPSSSVVVPQSTPRGLPTNGNLMPVPQSAPVVVPGNNDLVPLPQPELDSAFATIDNCNCVTAPSNYSAASAISGCAPASYQVPTTYSATPTPIVTTPAPIASPTVIPGAVAAPAGGAPAGSLITFGQEAYPVQVGQGWLGQPVAYVPGQRFRNWLRYIFP